jgi:hypothetical protein
MLRLSFTARQRSLVAETSHCMVATGVNMLTRKERQMYKMYMLVCVEQWRLLRSLHSNAGQTLIYVSSVRIGDRMISSGVHDLTSPPGGVQNAFRPAAKAIASGPCRGRRHGEGEVPSMHYSRARVCPSNELIELLTNVILSLRRLY